jgi:hypothetical protein
MGKAGRRKQRQRADGHRDRVRGAASVPAPNWASSMVMLDSARRGVRVPTLARWLFGLGIAATLAANVAHGLGHGLIGAAVDAWPAVALVGSCELLMMIIRGTQSSQETTEAAMVEVRNAEPIDALHARAAEEFADDVAAGCTPSIRAIRARLHVGQPRCRRRDIRLILRG